MFPSTSGTKLSELHVYTIEECQSCQLKTKRDFKVGDYITADAGTCEKCHGKKTIVSIYGEKPLKGRKGADASERGSVPSQQMRTRDRATA